MGAVCAKASSSTDNRSERFGNRRNNAISSVTKGTNEFTVTIECFCVPSNRLLPKPETLVGPGAGCRLVGVTTIHIVKPKGNVKGLNSVIYTPVLKWIGMDVEQQVPKFLPMNLWPGSYTIFAFYNHDNVSTSTGISPRVNLTAKMGSEQVCLEEQMDNGRYLTNEQWTHLSNNLEKELERMDVFSLRHKKSYDVATETEAGEAECSVVDEEDGGQRDSLDTGYISNKRSLEQSLFSVQCTGNTSESEDGEKLTAGKKLKMRRKDTPAHSLQHMRFSPLSITLTNGRRCSKANENGCKNGRRSFSSTANVGVRPTAQEFKACPLQEEPEAAESSDGESPSPQPYASVLIRPVSSIGIRSTTVDETDDIASPAKLSLKEELKMSEKLSKSYQDLRVDSYTPKRPLSYSDPGAEKRPAARRKKRSIISRIGGISIKVESESAKQKSIDEKDKDFDLGADADDEEDLSYTESENNRGCLSEVKGPSQVKEKETGSSNNTREGQATTEVKPTEVCPKGQSVANENLELTTEDDGENTKIENSFLYERHEMRKFSYSKFIEVQSSSVKDGETCVTDCQSSGVNNHPRDSKEKGRENKTIQCKSRTKKVSHEAQPESVVKNKMLERKSTDDLMETISRPRSRTLSRRHVLDVEETQYRARYTRPSKSVTLPKSNTVSKEGGKAKGSFYRSKSIKNSKTNLSNISKPPLSPKEAFSDA